MCIRDSICNAQRPAGVGQDLFDADAGMHRGEIGFAIVTEAQDAERGNNSRRAGRGGQTLRATPAVTGAESGRGDVADAIAEARTVVSEQHDRAARQASDVTRAAGTGEALHFFIAMAPGLSLIHI